MNVIKIVVDELPGTCYECELIQNYDNGEADCSITHLVASFRSRRFDCPLVVEDVCEWVGTTKRKGKTDEYILYKSPHEHLYYHGNYFSGVNGGIDETKRYIFCHVCGKRIKYVEVE